MEQARAVRCRSESRRGRAGDPSSTWPSAPNGVETAARMPLSFFVIFMSSSMCREAAEFCGRTRPQSSRHEPTIAKLHDCRQVHKGLGARSVIHVMTLRTSLNLRKWVLNWRNDSLMSLRGVLCVLERNGARAPRDQPVQFSPKARAPRGLGPPGAIVDVNFSDQHAHRRSGPGACHQSSGTVRTPRVRTPAQCW